MTYILTFLLILACGAADRVIGWGEWGRTKPVLATVATLAGIAYFAHFPVTYVDIASVAIPFTPYFTPHISFSAPLAHVTFPLAFMAWRTPAWELFGGSINPAPSQAGGTFFRHLVTLVFLIPAYFAHVSLLLTALWMVTFAVVATGLAVWNYENHAHANQTIETLRGMALGAFLSIAFLYSPA